MTFEELQNMPVEVKILDSTYRPCEATREMIGGIYEARSTDHHDYTYSVWTKLNSYWFFFNKSDCQIMTPLSYEGERIGIGDTVNNVIVYGFSWFDGGWILQVVNDNDFDTCCYGYNESGVYSHTPLYQSKLSQTDKELLAEVERRGLLKDAKVLK